MKKYRQFLLFLLMIWSSGFCYGQNTADTAKINFIKTQFGEINQNLKSYKKIEKTDTAETTEGNEVLLYYRGNEIRKIIVTYYRETGKAIEEFYFYNNKVIFCYLVNYHYNMPIYETNGGKIASSKEERIYLDNGKIFLVRKRPVDSDDFSEFSADPQKEANRLMNLK
jgi:hypothetical protein